MSSFYLWDWKIFIVGQLCIFFPFDWKKPGIFCRCNNTGVYAHIDGDFRSAGSFPMGLLLTMTYFYIIQEDIIFMDLESLLETSK